MSPLTHAGETLGQPVASRHSEAIIPWWDACVAFCTRPHCLIGLSLWRVSTGMCLLYWYLSHYFNRRYLWGPDGVVPFSTLGEVGWTSRLSLYALNPSVQYFELLFHLGVLVAVVFIIGWRTRLTAPLNLVFHYSLYNRNHYFPNAGDNLTIIIQLMLLLANTSAYVSLDAERWRARATGNVSTMWRIRAAIHNTALLASIVQLCIVYMTAGMHKVSGDMWNSGTALYYVLRVGEYSYPPYSDAIARNTYLVVALSYATVVFQLGFTSSLFNRTTRLLWMGGGLAFHAGIAVLMGLVTFSWFVLSVYTLLVADQEYLTLARLVKRRFRTLHRRVGPSDRDSTGAIRVQTDKL